MPKRVQHYPLLPLFRKFINEAKKGKHLQKSGKRIKRDSVLNYVYLETLLTNFSALKKIDLRLKPVVHLTKKQFDDEKKYWKDFYHLFTSYLYEDLGHFDNYVGRVIKLLRSFFNYLNNEKGMNIGTFHRKFYSPQEEIDILVISPERFNYLLHSEELNKLLNPELKKLKEVFLFGCAVALRFSDLMALTKANLEVINERMYIKMQSKKTQTFTRVKLPDYAIRLVNKYSRLYTRKLLPPFTKANFNKKIKHIMELAGFTEPIQRTRQRRGVPVIIFKDPANKTTYRFCDAVTSHTMRRSSITTMLSLGMNEQMVRQISGHAANSKDFYRYVAFAQNYIDNEIDLVHQKLDEKRLDLTPKMV